MSHEAHVVVEKVVKAAETQHGPPSRNRELAAIGLSFGPHKDGEVVGGHLAYSFSVGPCEGQTHPIVAC